MKNLSKKFVNNVNANYSAKHSANEADITNIDTLAEDAFKGGKGVSAFLGTALGTSWGLGWAPAFILYFPLLKKTRYVSLTSILIGFVYISLSWLWVILVLCKVIPHGYEWIPMYGPTINCTWHYALILTVMWVIMVIRHHENIKRIVNGNERKISWIKEY